MKITMPVGGIDEVIDIPEQNINEIIMPVHKPSLPNPKEKIREAVLNPIGTKRLSEIAREQFGKPGKRGGPYYKVAVAVDSYNRPTQHSLLFPPVLEELEKAGVKDEDIVIIEGCGFHRKGTPTEWERKWGKELRARFKDRMYSHTCPPGEYELFTSPGNVISYKKFQSPVKFIGTQKRGVPVNIDTHAAESDVLILLGQVSMNVAFGYGGGAKMILPAMATWEGLSLAHRPPEPGEKRNPRWEDNPRRLDINEWGDIAGVDFIVNVVHNTDGEIVAVAAGDHLKAWVSLLPFVNEMYIRSSTVPADIYICSASPRHTLSGAFASDGGWAVGGGMNATKSGGTMILAHRAVWRQHPIAHLGCPYFAMCEDRMRAEKYRREPSVIEGREIVVTGEGYSENDFEDTGFKFIPTLDEAIEYAFKKHGKSATVNISPYGGRFTYVGADGTNADFADDVMGSYASGNAHQPPFFPNEKKSTQ